jgi:hypothetical protein
VKKRLALLLTTLALSVPAATALAATDHLVAPAAAAKTCRAGYTLAHLSWGDKCLHAGEFCKRGNREYLRYGFSCPATGHLRRR